VDSVPSVAAIRLDVIADVMGHAAMVQGYLPSAQTLFGLILVLHNITDRIKRDADVSLVEPATLKPVKPVWPVKEA